MARLGRTTSHPRAFTIADDHQCLGHRAFRHVHPKSFCFIFRGGLLLPVKLDWSYFWPLLQASQIPTRHPWPQPGLTVWRRCPGPGSWRLPLQKVLDADPGALAAILSSVSCNPALLCNLRSSLPLTASVYWGTHNNPFPEQKFFGLTIPWEEMRNPAPQLVPAAFAVPRLHLSSSLLEAAVVCFFLLQSLKLPEDRASSCA